MDDKHFICEALKEAKKALKKGEVPVGAVVTLDDKIVGRGHNQNITRNDPTAHAEVVALRSASRKLNNYRLTNCKIYVTMEPCPMCAGAMVLARISEVIFGAYDKKAGACGSLINIADSKALNHRIKITGNILEPECRLLIQDFFKQKRSRKGSESEG